MRWISKQICLWLGHDLIGSDWECKRCGRLCDYDDAVKDSALDKIRAWWKRKLNWWRCEDCGRRFGRHDPAQDHLPF